MRKAQISLEMVIMLVVLLVLAGVIISLILHFLRPGVITPPEETLSKRNFEEKCTRLCEEGSVDYCREYWDGKDWDGNGIKSEIIQIGKYNWYACEDRIYCFLLVPCEENFGPGLTGLKKCKDTLCQAYLEKYGGDKDMATKALDDTIKFSVECSQERFYNLLENKPLENWHNLTFNTTFNSC